MHIVSWYKLKRIFWVCESIHINTYVSYIDLEEIKQWLISLKRAVSRMGCGLPRVSKGWHDMLPTGMPNQRNTEHLGPEQARADWWDRSLWALLLHPTESDQSHVVRLHSGTGPASTDSGAGRQGVSAGPTNMGNGSWGAANSGRIGWAPTPGCTIKILIPHPTCAAQEIAQGSQASESQ